MGSLSRLAGAWTALVAVSLSIVPVDSLVLVTVLVLAVDLGALLLVFRRARARGKKIDATVVVLPHEVPVTLRRRTERALRARRPGSIIEMQVRWRIAAEAHRRAQEMPEHPFSAPAAIDRS